MGEHVLERLVRAVTRWDVNARRDINYRSLSPIISLLSCHLATTLQSVSCGPAGHWPTSRSGRSPNIAHLSPKRVELRPFKESLPGKWLGRQVLSGTNCFSMEKWQ